MANAKRASMREGPLAALFRKTEADDESAASEQPAESAPPERERPPREGDPADASVSAPPETDEQAAPEPGRVPDSCGPGARSRCAAMKARTSARNA